MGSRAGSILFIVMLLICACAKAISVVTSDIIATSTDLQVPSTGEDSKASAKNEQLCMLCQEYATEVVEYLSDTETESKIISTLHQACSFLHGFKHKCVMLLDYYATRLFKEIVTTQPALFCEKVNLCEGTVSVRLEKHDDFCTACHHLVGEVLNKLEDPDTKLEIILTLLKGCNILDKVVPECKKLVFKYGPIILADAEKILKTRDICDAIHACKAPSTASLGEIFISSA